MVNVPPRISKTLTPSNILYAGAVDEVVEVEVEIVGFELDATLDKMFLLHNSI